MWSARGRLHTLFSASHLLFVTSQCDGPQHECPSRWLAPPFLARQGRDWRGSGPYVPLVAIAQVLLTVIKTVDLGSRGWFPSSSSALSCQEGAWGRAGVAGIVRGHHGNESLI